MNMMNHFQAVKEDNQINDSSHDFKNWLQNMPDIDESIFLREEDKNENRLWDI